jgi:hypothetical protein
LWPDEPWVGIGMAGSLGMARIFLA